MSADMQALLIEDEPQIRRFVRVALETDGWRVHEADTGVRGLIEAGTRRPDMLIVDLGLPDMEGVDLVREFRSWSDRPVLILSARSEEREKVEALDAGADDYLTKPFGVAELAARVRALQRRHLRTQEAAPTLRFGQVELDRSRRTVERDGVPVHLTQIEYRLLCVLAANAGKVMTHHHLMREVWGPNHGERGHYLRIYMSRLRQKLEADPAQPIHFVTETGVGYRFQL
ncbi:MAG TPA: response regulator [Burkholderiaceae bacterium]|nr:response regulator [Burkholderiaceae bacterium]